MTQLPLQTSASASRLVRLLAGWTEGEKATSAPRFAQRLGQLFDLPDSIRISSAHVKVRADHFAPPGLARDAVREEFFRLRAAIVRSALRSFIPGTGYARIRFPTPDPEATAAAASNPEPYLAFYAALQRDIDFRCRNLQAATRESVAGFSPALAQLCALDGALADPLAVHNRRFFAAVPRLLEKRIEVLTEQYRQALPQDGHDTDLWARTLETLRNNMQGLLLAEIETRLLPALGLIEALDEHTQR